MNAFKDWKPSDVDAHNRNVKTALAHNAPQVGHSELTPLEKSPEFSLADKFKPFTKPSGTRYNQAVVLAWFAACELPAPVCELCFALPRKFRFDFAWPGQKVALECEGGIWSGGAHGRGSGIIRDLEKYNLAAELGWRVLRCVPDDLCITETAELLKRTMNL